MRKVFKNLKYIFHSQNSNQINLNVMRQKFLHAIKKKKILLGIIMSIWASFICNSIFMIKFYPPITHIFDWHKPIHIDEIGVCGPIQRVGDAAQPITHVVAQLNHVLTSTDSQVVKPTFITTRSPLLLQTPDLSIHNFAPKNKK